MLFAKKDTIIFHRQDLRYTLDSACVVCWTRAAIFLVTEVSDSISSKLFFHYKPVSLNIATVEH